jgi:hypothetical protein
MAEFCAPQNAGFSLFLPLHNPNNRLENISIFYLLPLQLSSQKYIILSKTYWVGGFCPPPPCIPQTKSLAPNKQSILLCHIPQRDGRVTSHVWANRRVS